MANLVFNIGLGRGAYYGDLSAANDALVMVPLETTGLVADSTLRDYDDLATLLAGATNEQTTLGRKSITSATVTVSDASDNVSVDIADQTYTAASGNAVSKIILCYDSDTTGGGDASIVPWLAWDVTWTPDGNDTTIQINASGAWSSSSTA